ncbi:hypothetical protein FEM08_16270 [Flavobacterium gilvum]|nr:hypothetical protein FEM08_16270 [Flavobacterium gilvum]
MKSMYASISINEKGNITSIKDLTHKKEYLAKGQNSPLLSVYIWEKKQTFEPASCLYNKATNEFTFKYENGTEAIVKVTPKKEYFRFELIALKNRNGVDNVIWGPVKTSISKTIGELIGVVRDDNFAIGMFGLNDNTTTGLPANGDSLEMMHYYIHSPDPVKYPLPANLKEGQKFRIGGDGVNDVAFYSHPEEYYRMTCGNGAILEPSYGSYIVYHSRDRRKAHTISKTIDPDILFQTDPQHMVVDGLEGVDLLNSAIALYACPDKKGLSVIETIVKNEGLPYITDKGKWIKSPKNNRPDVAWSGVHDSLISYTKQIGFKGVQDEGQGGGYAEYYYNPGNRLGGMKGKYSKGKIEDIRIFGERLKKEGIAYGVHTLCEFIQTNSSDVTPVPNKNLLTLFTVQLDKDVAPKDTIIVVKDTLYLNERGEANVNVLKLGNEIIHYKGVTKTRPYTLIGVERGYYKTFALAHKKGDNVSKLKPSAYSGLMPDMILQDTYARAYADLLNECSMDFIDFDGMESCLYQGHGYYSYKRFFRSLFDQAAKHGNTYIRVMGAGPSEGNWLYMNTINLGGGNHMFNQEAGTWGIEGKDMRYIFESSYMPGTFGIQSFPKTEEIAHNLQCKSIGWGAQYMLGMSQEAVEKNPEKFKIFKALKAWETAREADVFTEKQKENFKSTSDKFKIEQTSPATWILYTQKGGKGQWIAEKLSSK